MGGNPSRRGHTLLLADWLRDQISACTRAQSTNTEMQASSAPCIAGASKVAAGESSVGHGLTTATSATAAATAGTSASNEEQQERHKMRQEPSLSPPYCPKAAPRSPRARTGHLRTAGSTWAPHLPASASQQTLASWQGLLLPQECESLGLGTWAEEVVRDHPDQGRRALGVLGAGYGLLVHQVAMHCFERGALMAGVWNMYTALMDAEVQSLEEHIKVLMHVTDPVPYALIHVTDPKPSMLLHVIDAVPSVCCISCHGPCKDADPVRIL